MRIAILANVPVWFLPGLEHLRHTRHYATWLEPLIPAFEEHDDFDLHWITICKETAVPIEHRAFGQTFHILPRGRLSVAMGTRYLAETRRIRSVIDRLSPGLVHAWGSEEGYGIAGVRSGVERRLFTLQGCLTDYVRQVGGGVLFRLQASYERATVRCYGEGTAESPGAAALLRGLHPGLRIEQVDYGVNAEFFGASWNPSPDPVVLFVGGVNGRKGISDLVEVAARPELASVEFRIVGEGPLREELSARSTANITWLGQCDRRQVVGELEKAWQLAIPTFADTGPTVIKEARVIGLPIVTTTAAGASSYVSETGCGDVIEPGNREALAAAVARACASRAACQELGRKGWPEHRETLHPSTTARKFAAIYQRMANDA